MPTPPVPTPIDRIHSFTTWQTDHPNSPLPGDWVDEDVDQSNAGINLVAERLALIQRDDGGLANGSVTADSLNDDVLGLVSEAEASAVAAAQAAAADAQAAADSAAASAVDAASSAVDAAAAEQFATNAAAYEQGAITAQTAAEAAAADAAGSAAQMPGPPLTAGKGLIVNPGATAYVLQDVMTDTGDGKWNGAAKVIKSVAAAVAPTDATNLTQVQALIAGGGSVPPPLAGDVDKVLTATGASAFNWLAMTLARISDMSAFMRGFNTLASAAAALAALGGVPTTRQIIAGTGLTGGGDLSADRTLNVANQAAVVPGTYGPATATVNAQGIITAIANTTIRQVPDPAVGDVGKFLKATAANVWAWAFAVVADLSDATAYMKGLLTTINNAAALLANIGAVPTTRTITVTAPITGGGSLAADRSIGHAASGVGAGSYVNPSITVDATGHVTAAANGGAVPAAATQAEMEAMASLTAFAPPGRLHLHPGIPKALFWFNGNTVGTNAPLGGYGCTQVQRLSAGSYECTMPTAMSSTNYGVLVTTQSTGATHDPTTKTTTVFRVANVNSAGALADTPLVTVAVYGDWP